MRRALLLSVAALALPAGAHAAPPNAELAGPPDALTREALPRVSAQETRDSAHLVFDYLAASSRLELVITRARPVGLQGRCVVVRMGRERWRLVATYTDYEQDSILVTTRRLPTWRGKVRGG